MNPEGEPMTVGVAGVYQQLRAHLAYLKLGTAAEELPGVLEAARTESLTPTAVLEGAIKSVVHNCWSEEYVNVPFGVSPTERNVDHV